MAEYRTRWVTYEEAQGLLGILDFVVKEGTMDKTIKENAQKLREDLRRVRGDISYKGTPRDGHQLRLPEGECKLFDTIWELYQAGIIPR